MQVPRHMRFLEEPMKTFLIETSARHVHLSEADLATLFGAEHKLTPKKDLSQPGQFACEERVTVVGPKRELANVSILGPTRPESQVEISLTDARSIGADAPVRESGDLAGSAPVTLVGPAGSVDLPQGCIVAQRHIHLTPKAAADLGVTNSEIVNVGIDANGRKLIFGDVVVRVSDKYAPAMHIDTDESNAAGVPCEGYIVR